MSETIDMWPLRLRLAELCGLARCDLYWRPDEDIAQAMRCLEAARALGWEFEIRFPLGRVYEIQMIHVDVKDREHGGVACDYGTSLAAGICDLIATAFGWVLV